MVGVELPEDPFSRTIERLDGIITPNNNRQTMAGRKPTVSDERILEIIENNPDPVATTSEVSEVIDISVRGTNSRLVDLTDQGCLNKKMAGRSAIWWLSDDGRDFLEADVAMVDDWDPDDQ